MKLLPFRLTGGVALGAVPCRPRDRGDLPRVRRRRARAPPPVAPPPVINQSADPLLQSFRFRSIGPASMGGRIDDIAVSESDPNVIYLGYAVGGVFKSENNGVSFEPVFQTYGTASIGDIAIHPTRSEHRLRRHRRGEQPPDLVVRRRHLQDHRRRQDLHQHRPARRRRRSRAS